ncbi:MAG TPA: two-component sensor histidine kinase [Acidimicrobiaceae bacterium]|nr:two-component sensor histidine kinase [Acidimicrobiaceae bacterium]
MTLFRKGREQESQLRSELAIEQARLRACEHDAARLREVLDAVPVGLVLADHRGVPLLHTPAARFGGHADVLVGEALEAILGAAAAGEATQRRLDLVGPPAKVLQIRGIPLGSGGALAVIDDLTERTRLDAVRTDFVANISHELKTPVGALAVLAEAVADHDDPDVMRGLAERMVMEAHRASSTIDDLLELSRIELGGEAAREVVDLGMVVAEAVHRTALAAERRGISLRVDDPHPPKAIGDSRQLVSALANLLDNAVKYSHDGGTVTIGVTANDGWVEIAVADRGVGIPTRDLDRIFERFYRVDRARSRETGGTGLGLAIVRHVATNHGGEVRVQSHEGEGSVFTLRVPAAESLPTTETDD